MSVAGVRKRVFYRNTPCACCQPAPIRRKCLPKWRAARSIVFNLLYNGDHGQGYFRSAPVKYTKVYCIVNLERHPSGSFHAQVGGQTETM